MSTLTNQVIAWGFVETIETRADLSQRASHVVWESEMTNQEDVREELARQLGTGTWSLLKSHSDAGRLFVVDTSLALLDAAVALATDQSSEVTHWIESARLRRGDDERDAGGIYQFVVVAPFVLAQRVELPEEAERP